MTLLLLWLKALEIAIRLVARRVAEGGLDVPRERLPDGIGAVRGT